MGKKTIEIPAQDQNDTRKETYLLLSLLPPPISLDLLCAITGGTPTTILQILEEFVQSAVLKRYKEKGIGYYYVPDFESFQKQVWEASSSALMEMAQRAITSVSGTLPDSAKKWLHLAHIYQISGLPLRHHKEVIKAGHYCLDLNLPMDATLYYQMALEGMDAVTLDPKDQIDFIDAAIGICTGKDNALPIQIQQKYLSLALKFGDRTSDPIRRVKLRVLLAKTFAKTVHNEEAMNHIESAWRMLSEYDFPSEVQLQVALAKSEILYWRGYMKEAIELYESVIGSLEELPSNIETLKSCIRLGRAYAIAGELARGIGLIRAVRRKAKEFEAHDLELYATLFIVINLSDAGKIDEAEGLLNEIFSTPEVLLDHYMLWPGNGKRSYFAFCKGDYKNAFKYLDMAWQNSKALGTPHHHGPDNLEIMLGLEDMGMVHAEWTFEWDVNRLINWPDIYMQGIAYRFRALKAYGRNGSLVAIKEDLKKSLSLLSTAGANIELSHAKVLLARIHIKENNIIEAEKLLNAAWEIFSKVNPDLFPKDLKPYLDRTSKIALWVESLFKIGEALSATRTRDDLLSKIIRQAMRIAGAERGAIFLRQNKRLEMVAGRNISVSEIGRPAFSAQMKQVEEVFESGSEMVKKSDARRTEEEASTKMIRWTGCFPIRMKNKVIGVFYIDHGPTNLELQEDEIFLLRIISNQATVALDNIEAYEEIIDLNSELAAETHFYRETFGPGPCL